MARNEEKQQGRLNRLWLQREREEGRLPGARERRPKLSSLSSASSVKKWLPSITRELDYFLEQSQLSHYPERKIAEFQLQIESLEKLHKRFVTKLRLLEPGCPLPGAPRGYSSSKRRRSVTGGTAGSQPPHRASREREYSTSTASQGHTAASHSETLLFHHPPSQSATQDLPLTFDHTKLAVATAAFRGRSAQSGSSQSLIQVLQSGLPNLNHTSTTSSQKTEEKQQEQEQEQEEQRAVMGSAESKPGVVHLLGLDCYSSSDEEAI